MQPFKQQYLVLSAQQYRIVDENTGEINEGISLWYIPTDSLDPVEDEQARIRGDLERIYKILDNREIFLNYLNTKTLAFHKGKDINGNVQYLDWWKRLRRAKACGIKADEKLLRDYSFEMDKKCVQRRAINALASSAVYDDKLDTGFIEDVSDFLSDLSDNEAHKRARLLFVDQNGEVADDVRGKLLSDYYTIKAKKEVQLRNRKKRKKDK